MTNLNGLLVIVVLSAVSLGAADLRIKTLQHVERKGVLTGGSTLPPSRILYVHGTVQREEFIGYVDGIQGPPGQQPPHMAVITHCDTGVEYQIDLDHHEYREFKLPKYLSEQEFDKQVQDAKKEAQKRSKSNIVDTGETRDFYGHTARHLIATITTKMETLQSQETIDGWYVDLPEPGCAPEYIRRGHGRRITGAHAKLIPQGNVDPGTPTHPPMVDNAPRDIFIYTGFMPEGWAIDRTIMNQYHVMRNWDETSGEFLEEQQVVEFSESPLDPSLFELPPGFDKVKELYKHSKR